MTTSQDNIASCPNWSDSKQRCKVHSEGLYIPLEPYVVHYCTSGSYPTCPYLSHNLGKSYVTEKHILVNIHSDCGHKALKH